MTSAEIRKQFLEFFQLKGHTIVPSAPIVVKNDPTLLFTNAGMNQFKDYFLGNKKAPHARVADTQKCLRVSGKHNDLEEVGVDTYHHTMFEMLGNWSFGDPAQPGNGYFKKEAIAWSWELLTQIYQIPKDRLYVTVFGGDEKEGLPADAEALEEWKKWLDADRILMGSKKDNFWEMGDTGPCGPCTEIHVDCRADEKERQALDATTLVNNDHPQVIEIWNNVFIQFNRLKNGSLEPLPARHVDTGMGLERLVRVLQKKQSNYDTDLFSGTIEAIGKITGKKYDYGDSRQAIAFRVLADHIRAIGFTIADGQLPSNTGAGYVIRRILRRAVRYYFSYLDYKQPLLFQLMPVLAGQFREVFPELFDQLDFVSKVVKEEEEAFLRTLDAGLKRMDGLMADAGGKTINGKDAFELYDTFGFPFDLTKLIAAEHRLGIDENAFDVAMQQQKQRSRSATAIDAGDWNVLDEYSPNEFVGYDSLEVKTKIARFRKVSAKGKESFQLVLAATPFYAESGGQAGDSGELLLQDNKIRITDTKKENNLVIHFADALPEQLSGEVIAKVDLKKRKATAIHHSATHLLHAALRAVLGTHVAQKGSLVNEEHLRFDFSHFAKVTDAEIRLIEEQVNAKIRQNIPVIIREMQKEEALKMGAMALFGEKYGDTVRVVIIDPSYSVELCGGTHVAATGELGYFKIKHETAIAAGVRRIEAVSGAAADQYVEDELGLIRSIRETLKNPKDIAKSIEQLLNEQNGLKKLVESLEAKQLNLLKKELIDQKEMIGDTVFIGAVVDARQAEQLKTLSFEIKKEFGNFISVLVANIDGKAHVSLALGDELVQSKSLEAPAIIKEHISPLIKGGGGGQKNLASAGGTDTSRLGEVITTVRLLLKAKITG